MLVSSPDSLRAVAAYTNNCARDTDLRIISQEGHRNGTLASSPPKTCFSISHGTLAWVDVTLPRLERLALFSGVVASLHL
jgi:hypothetical protein